MRADHEEILKEHLGNVRLLEALLALVDSHIEDHDEAWTNNPKTDVVREIVAMIASKNAAIALRELKSTLKELASAG